MYEHCPWPQRTHGLVVVLAARMDWCDSASVLREGWAHIAYGAQKGDDLLLGSQRSPGKATWSYGFELNFEGWVRFSFSNKLEPCQITPVSENSLCKDSNRTAKFSMAWIYCATGGRTRNKIGGDKWAGHVEINFILTGVSQKRVKFWPPFINGLGRTR